MTQYTTTTGASTGRLLHHLAVFLFAAATSIDIVHGYLPHLYHGNNRHNNVQQQTQKLQRSWGVQLLPIPKLTVVGKPTGSSSSSSGTIAGSSTCLEMAKVKRGKLASIVSSTSDDDDIPKSRRRKKLKQRSKRGTTKTAEQQQQQQQKKRGKQTSGGISPALAEWMSSQEEEEGQQQDNASMKVGAYDDDDDDDDDDLNDSSKAIFTSFEGMETKKRKGSGSSTGSKKNQRRSKQQARMVQEKERENRILRTLATLEGVLNVGNEKEKKKTTATMEDILDPIRKLIQEPIVRAGVGGGTGTGNLRQLTAGAKRYNYRLAWVGSDDAICHIGTGLHKVPLARLQEVFMSFTGRNTIQILEVIRILGPFPNVKNILQGSTKVGKNLQQQPQQQSNNNNDDTDNDSDTPIITEFEITYDSMVDGTGKEILAGTADNIRRTNLQIYFCDERAIVAVVPPPAESSEDRNSRVAIRNDPLEDNGSNILVFVREDSLDDKLESLRVA